VTPVPSPQINRGAHWMDRASCVEEDPELFFPVGASKWAMHDLELARRVCRGCAVRARCLERALKVGAEFGIWAGTTPVDRRRIRRRAEAARHRNSDVRAAADD
jgi:WhiB family redox-sensing transcriptional regulator